MLRSIKSSQRAPRQLMLRIDGTGTASITLGSTDVTLVDNGTGDYTLTFAKAFARVPVVFIQAVSATGDVISTIGTLSASAVQVKCWDGTDGTTAKDALFHLIVCGYDSPDQI